MNKQLLINAAQEVSPLCPVVSPEQFAAMLVSFAEQLQGELGTAATWMTASQLAVRVGMNKDYIYEFLGTAVNSGKVRRLILKGKSGGQSIRYHVHEFEKYHEEKQPKSRR